MSFRLIDTVAAATLFIGGAALTPGTIGGDPGRVLATFLGLFSASILPTVSLLVNGMTASGRSVQALNNLQKELDAAMDALFFLFGCIVLAIGALVSLSIHPAEFMIKIPYLTTEILPRLGQALVVMATGMVLFRAGQIPGILRRSLAARHEIAIAEARSKLESNAPAAADIRQAFATHPDFGKVVSLQDLQAPEKRQ
ncbi:hypothetical protein AB9E06_21460 [Rhizobium leguminosarum]|uniref:hypothetical protein n=1 Tax=Rhizobium leguminosarum TaxID=384 RepID=UPI003F976D12